MSWCHHFMIFLFNNYIFRIFIFCLYVVSIQNVLVLKGAWFTLCSLLFIGQIPVFKGADKPILGNTIDGGLFHGVDGLGDAPDPSAPSLDLVQKESAVSAMIRIANENPGEVRDVTELHVCICASCTF